MESLLNFAMGPLFRFCFALMVLGLLRRAVIGLYGIRQSMNSVRDSSLRYRQIFADTLSWVIPIKRLPEAKPVFSAISFGFHIGLIFVPLFLADHYNLWRSTIDIPWPRLGRAVADIATLLTLCAGGVMLTRRIFIKEVRRISDLQDYVILTLLLCIFLTGYISSRPYNPLSYSTTLLLHTLLGNAALELMPFTKLAHAVLCPFVRIISIAAWKLPATIGRKS